MFDIDKWQEILHVLTSNKLRTFLTAFGVFWGIFMLVVMLGSGSGLQNGIMFWFEGFATNSAFVWGNKTTISYNGLQRGRYVQFDNDDMDAIRRQIKGIKILSPRTDVQPWKSGDSANIVVYKKNRSAFSINGNVPDQRLVESIKLEKGRYINDLDISMNRKIAVIGSRVREVIFPAGEEPPAKAFWSLTVYGPDMFFYDNPLNRYSLGDRTPGLKRTSKGLSLLIGGPRSSDPSNWLPAPPGPYRLGLRIYEGRQEVVEALWFPPPLRRT